MYSTNSRQFKPPTITDVKPQPITLSEHLRWPFQIVNADVLQEIFIRLKVEDLKVLHSVCRSFHAITTPYLTYTVLRISDKPNEEPDFIEFRKLCKKFAYPFLYDRVVSIKLEQFSKPFKAKYPVLAIFTAYGILPKWVDTLQLYCIANSSIDPMNWSRYSSVSDCYKISISALLVDYELPKLRAVIIHDANFTFEEMHLWKANPRLQYLDISRSNMAKHDGFSSKRQSSYSYYPLNNLKVLISTLEHDHYLFKDLPPFFDIVKCAIHLPETDYHNERFPDRNLGARNFDVDRYPSLKSL
jgi:hypothetical protein